MILQTAPVAFVHMARKELVSKKDQINFRLKTEMIEEMEEFRDRHHLHPTLTQIAESAIAAWLKEHAKELPPKGK